MHFMTTFSDEVTEKTQQLLQKFNDQQKGGKT